MFNLIIDITVNVTRLILNNKKTMKENLCKRNQLS